VTKSGQCGVAMQASYPTKSAAEEVELAVNIAAI
jgi:hypothetical protein